MLVVGVVLLLMPKLGALGRLPGDIRFDRGSTSISIPLATSLLLSVLLTILLNIFARR